ncbi:5853_t:CDS:2, partial [Dentiscutata erythropus]
ASKKHNNANVLLRLHNLENEVKVRALEADLEKIKVKLSKGEKVIQELASKKTRQRINLELHEVVNLISEMKSEEKQQEEENSSNEEGLSDTDQPTVYHLEFITFPLIANDPTDLITLQQWVAEGAEEAGKAQIEQERKLVRHKNKKNKLEKLKKSIEPQKL